MQSIVGFSLLALPYAVPSFAPRKAAALRWFVKSLSTDLLHDEFMFLWIALEVLCDLAGPKVISPYFCPKGHAIPECPTCHTSTAKEVRGQTLRSFLQEPGGVDIGTGKELWTMRQMMHGATDFNSTKLERLPALVQTLRAAVATALKDALGIPEVLVSIVRPEGLMIQPSAGVVGSKPLSSDDLLALDQLIAG